MKHVLSAVVALTVCVSASAKEPKKKTMLYSVTGEDIAAIVELDGHKTELSVDSYGDPLLTVRTFEGDYQVLFYDCDEEKRCTSFEFRRWWTTEGDVSVDVINAYNVERRIGKAFLDSDGDANLGFAVWTSGGVSADYILAQLHRYQQGMKDLEARLRQAISAAP